MSRYNDPPRYYNHDYKDNYYAPPSQQFERRPQVAKKSTAQQAQVHQYGHKRPPGPDFHQGSYKRSRQDDYRYSWGMSPREYNKNGMDSRRGRGSHPPPGQHHRGPGRPPKFSGRQNFSQDDWGRNDFNKGPSPSRAERSRSSEPKRTEEHNKPRSTEESTRSQSQGGSPSRGRGRPPKSSNQGSSDKSTSNSQANPQSANSAVEKGTPQPSKPPVVKGGPQASKSAVAKDSPQASKSAVAKGGPQASKSAVAKGSPVESQSAAAKGGPRASKSVAEKVTSNSPKPNQVKSATKTVVNNSISSNASTRSKKTVGSPVANQGQSSIKVKANARKSTRSPGKVRPSDEQVLGPDSDVEWKVLSETGSDSEDARLTRPTKPQVPDVRVTAVDNVLRIEKMRKEEEARAKAAEAAALRESVPDTATNTIPGTGEAATNNCGAGVQKTNPPTTLTTARKSLPNLARKVMPPLTNKATTSGPPSAGAAETKNSEVPNESAQASSGKQGMARKSAPKSSSQKTSENEDESKQLSLSSDGIEKSASMLENDKVSKAMNGPTSATMFKPFGPRITRSARKSAPPSSNSPAKKLTQDTRIGSAKPQSDQKSNSSSQSARTAPRKDTARKSAPPLSNPPKPASGVMPKDMARKLVPSSSNAPKPTSGDTARKTAPSSSSTPNSTSGVTQKDTARKSAPPSSNTPKPTSAETPKVHSTLTSSDESPNTAPDQQETSRSNLPESSTVPMKQLHPPKNSRSTATAQVMPTAKKTAPPSEQPKMVPKVSMPVQPKTLESINAALSDEPKDKAKKTFSLAVFKSGKLKNILGKVSTKMEAKNSSSINDTTVAHAGVKMAVDKKEIVDKKEDLLKEPLANESLTKVKQMLPEVTKFEAPNEKLRGVNTEDQKNVKKEVMSEVKSEVLTTKQETKDAVILNVPQFHKNIEAKNSLDLKEEMKVDDASVADAAKMEVKPKMDGDCGNTKMDLTKEKPNAKSETQQVEEAKKTPGPEVVKSSTTVQFVVGAKSLLLKSSVVSALEQVVDKPLICDTSTKTNDNAILETAKSTVEDAKAEEVADQRKDEKADEAPSEDTEKSSGDSEKVMDSAVELTVKVDSLQAETILKPEDEKDREVKVTDNAKVVDTDAVTTKQGASDAEGNAASSSSTSSDDGKSQMEPAKQLRIEDHNRAEASPSPAVSVPTADKRVQEESTAGSEEKLQGSNQSSVETEVKDTSDSRSSAEVASEVPENSDHSATDVHSKDSAADQELTKTSETASAVEQLHQKSLQVQKDSSPSAKLPPTSLAKTIISRSSPGRKSGESYLSDDALLLNSSTNDSAEEPMDVDGDSEMDDCLLANDDVQSKEKVSTQSANNKEVPMDTAKKEETEGIDSTAPLQSEKQTAQRNVPSESSPANTSKTMELDVVSSKPELTCASEKQASIATPPTVPGAVLQKENNSSQSASESNANVALDNVTQSIDDMSAKTDALQSQPHKSKTSADNVTAASIPNSQPGQVSEPIEKEKDTSSASSVKNSDVAISKTVSISEEVPDVTEATVPSGISDQKEKVPTKQSITKEKGPVESSTPVPTPVNNQSTVSTLETSTNGAAGTSLPSDSSKKTLEGSTNSSRTTPSSNSTTKLLAAAETSVLGKSVEATGDSSALSISHAKLVEAEQEKVKGGLMEQTSSTLSTDKPAEQKPSDKPSEEKTEEQKEATQTVTPVSDKVTPSMTAGEQSKSSRSATPSGTNDSGADDNFDIIELSSDEDNNSGLSGKPKLKKKLKAKPGAEQVDGSSKPVRKRSASPQQLEGKAKKKAKVDEAKEQIDLSSLSKPELFTKLIGMKVKQHLKKYMDLAAQAKALKEQLVASEASWQKWQMESTRLQIKVHELTEQNDILRNKRKTVPSRVVVATGTQYDRVDILQAHQVMAGTSPVTTTTTTGAKQSLAVAPSPSTPQMRVTAQQVPHQLPTSSSQPTVASPSLQQQRPVASDVSRPSPMMARPGASIASPMRQTVPQAVNAATVRSSANASAAAGGGTVKAPVMPNKQLNNPFGHQQPQSRPLNLQSPARTTSAPVATSPLTSSAGGIQASVRPQAPAPTAKPGDVQANSSAAKHPASAPTTAALNSHEVIDLTDDDESNKAAAAANKGRVQPLNSVRTPQGGQVRGPPQQVCPKTPPAAHSRTTPPRAGGPPAAASKQQPAANVVRGTVATSKPGQLQQTASSRLAEFIQIAQQQGQQVQILQTRQIPAAGQQQQQAQQLQRSIATQQGTTVHAIAAPPSTAASNPEQTEVQKQIANIQVQIAQFEALAQNTQQSIEKLKEDDVPYERRRIEILKQLQMGNHGTYKTQEFHMQIRHIQSEQTRIQSESKTKVGQLQQYQHSKYQLQQNLQQLQQQQAVQQGQQQQVQQTLQQQIAQVSRPAASIPSTAVVPPNPRRHPAPLPTIPNSNISVVSNAAPPPKPTLSISKVNQGFVLSWNMSISTHVHATIDFYNLYAYQETDAAPNTSLWKKIGEVKALQLPMACTLTQFQPGSMYHFAVCAIDIYHRTGPFSDPSSINLPAT